MPTGSATNVSGWFIGWESGPGSDRRSPESDGDNGDHTWPLLSARVWQDGLSAPAAKTVRPDVSPRAGPLPVPASSLPPGAQAVRWQPVTPPPVAAVERSLVRATPCGQTSQSPRLRKYLS